MSVLAALLVDASESVRTLPVDADPDLRIRARLDACREGMAQLDALREKHQRLMETMRVRMPPPPKASSSSSGASSGFSLSTSSAEPTANVRPPPAPPKRAVNAERHTPKTEAEVNNNNNSNNHNKTSQLPTAQVHPQQQQQAHSPTLGCYSHRSSVSVDSGCGVSIASQDAAVVTIDAPPMPYATYRKKSMEERAARNSLLFDDAGPPPPPHLPLHEPLEWPAQQAVLLRRRPRGPSAAETQRRSLVDDNDNYQIVASTIASTTAMRAPSMRKFGARLERPRSMFEKRQEEEEQRRVAAERDAYRNSTLDRTFTRDSYVDSMSFSQITPPPVQRKFGVVEDAAARVQPRRASSPLRPAALPPLALTVNKTPPSVAALVQAMQPSAGSGTLYKSPSAAVSTPTFKSAMRFTPSTGVAPGRQPHKAEITPPRDVYRAEARVVTSSASTILSTASSSSSSFKSSAASRTPPTKRIPRPLSVHELKVAPLTPDEEIDGIFHARPARVLSRQSSAGSSSSSSSAASPPGAGRRKCGVVAAPSARVLAAHQQMLRRSSESSTGARSHTVSPAISRASRVLEKSWRESEGL